MTGRNERTFFERDGNRMNIFSLTIGDNIELRCGVKFVLNDVAYGKILAKWNDDGSYRGKMVPSPMDIMKVNGNMYL